MHYNNNNNGNVQGKNRKWNPNDFHINSIIYVCMLPNQQNLELV